MRKADIQFHSDGYRAARPAVNVKVYKGIETVDFKQFHDEADDGFTLEWIRENVSDERLDSALEWACERAWEQVETDAQQIFGSHVKVYSEGRSGGWAVVEGLPDFGSWDAIMVGKWARFARRARSIADDIPYQMIDDLCFNVYIRDKEEATEEYVNAVSLNTWSAGLPASADDGGGR